MELLRPFIRLPYAFDAAQMAAEARQIPASAWMAHPSGMRGNSAVALVSKAGGDNDQFAGQMGATRHLQRCEYLQQILASFGEVIGRSRLMKLGAGCEVSTHVDFNYHWHSRVRIHIPITTFPEVIFHCANERVHMESGQCWIFNSWRRHRVVNTSDQDRIHLVIDTAGSSTFWRMVRQMQAIEPESDQREIESRVNTVVYEPGKTVDVLTERFNIAPVMAPGELDGLIKEVIEDFRGAQTNDRELMHRYEVMLDDFAKDWRQTWSMYGYDQSGRVRYQALIDRVHSQLHPNRKALVTQSNQVGVNPIIVQRILMPALAPHQSAAFKQALESES